VEEDEDDTSRLSKLIALAEAGLQAEEDAFFSQVADEAKATSIGDRQIREMRVSLAT
jgi:hypothetical protein